MNVKWYLVVLACIVLIISDVEHLFMCFLDICMSLEKYLYKFFAHFKFRLVFCCCLLLNCMSSVCIWAVISYQIYDLQIFSSILWVAFSLLIVFFQCLKVCFWRVQWRLVGRQVIFFLKELSIPCRLCLNYLIRQSFKPEWFKLL